MKKQVETKQLFSATLETDVSIYYSKHQSYICFCFPRADILNPQRNVLYNGAKKCPVVFLTFRRLSCTVLYNRTVVSQPGAWEVNAGFPTESSSCRVLVMAVACFLSELCV